jgi:hypothetical protein
MSVSWNPQANSIFLEALELPESAREAFLAEACDGDTALADQVRLLLAASHEAGAFLESPPTAVVQLADTERELDAELPTLDFLSPSDRPELLGQLGHYDVHEVIGVGGMGIVFKAFDQQLHRVVAIKVMASRFANSGAARKQFKREAQAAAAVSHDHIVTIHAVDDAGERPYFVMQYVPGLSLQQRIDRDGPLRLSEILRIGMQTAAGLAAAHAQGLIHRDIKPANILLENSVERVKITDFGLARVATEASTTQSGLIAGTPQYMSPEQAEGETIDQRSDLFSLGSVLYAMCTGRAPFRAAGTMGVLKRVCEEKPTPIRETNPEIPEWLAAIIDKLHAKDPAERYQSGAEVADLFAVHLAELQHPSVVRRGASSPQTLAVDRHVSRRGLRWAAATVALLCLLGGLTFTEATGVTSLGTTVVRIFTPDGTLVVDTDDPSVKVTIEGDGGLIINGAGAQEVRLRPGNYKVRADKEGTPIALDQDLVTISGPGRQRVRVRLEGPLPDTTASTAEEHPFVLLGGQGVAERRFDTLAEAVLTATDGDTIEIRGNGPFLTPPIVIFQSLTIRAGNGFMPVIRLTPGEPRDDCLLEALGSLVLEGLEIREVSEKRTRTANLMLSVIASRKESLHLANCRIFQEEPILEDAGLIYAETERPADRQARPNVTLRNCQFRLRNKQVASFDNEGPVSLVMENSLCVGGFVTYLNHSHAGNGAVQEFRRNTVVSSFFTMVGFSAAPEPPRVDAQEKLVRFDASDNVIDLKWAMMDIQALEPFAAQANWQQAGDPEAVFMPIVVWHERRNVFSAAATAIYWAPRPFDGGRILAPANLQDWQHRWNLTDSESFEGIPRFHGGDLWTRAAIAPEKITPDDFRLRPDSAGYRAGPDGKDLGADVDLVGPGAAYERWKKTSEYQEWLVESGQLKE